MGGGKKAKPRRGAQAASEGPTVKAATAAKARQSQSSTIPTGGSHARSGFQAAAPLKLKPSLVLSESPTSTSHNGLVARRPVLSAAACAAVIAAAERRDDWCDTRDSVDGQHEWQTTIVDGASGRRRVVATSSSGEPGDEAAAQGAPPHDADADGLGALVDALATHAILPALSAKLGIDVSNLFVHWAFVRRCAVCGRPNTSKRAAGAQGRSWSWCRER